MSDPDVYRLLTLRNILKKELEKMSTIKGSDQPDMECVPGALARDLLHVPELVGDALLQWSSSNEQRHQVVDRLRYVADWLEA